jgi:hypothetical protein
MSKGLQWLIGICVVLVVAAMVFSIIAPFFLPRLGLAVVGGDPRFGGEFGFGGPGHMFSGRGMMGGLRMPFLGLGMLVGGVAHAQESGACCRSGSPGTGSGGAGHLPVRSLQPTAGGGLESLPLLRGEDLKFSSRR